jgi:hypothetical protein
MPDVRRESPLFSKNFTDSGKWIAVCVDRLKCGIWGESPFCVVTGPLIGFINSLLSGGRHTACACYKWPVKGKVMSSEKQVAASRENGKKSRGPTEKGRQISKMNARKHGLRSKRKAVLVDLGYAHEERRRKWLAQHDAQTDYDEFMISSSVSLACDVERSRRVCAADVEIKTEDADADDAERADELGDLLFFDPTGPTVLYGIDPVPLDTIGPSWNGKAGDPNKPSRIVRRLQKTLAGCEFLLREWKRLRSLAETGFWLSPDRFRAVRMLGRQPVDVLEHREVAMIFVASRGIVRLGKNEFDDLLGDMNEHALDQFMLRVKARFSDLFHDSTAAEYRQMLIDLADEHIKRLNSKCARHLKKAAANAARTIDKLGEDHSPKGASAKQLELKCMNTIKRLMAPYQKEADKPRGGGKRAAGCPDEGRKVRGESWGERGERCSDGGRSGCEGEETYGHGNGGVREPRRTEGEPSGGRARADQWERTIEELDESDIRACGGFLPLGRTGLASATLETEHGSGLASGALEAENRTSLDSATLEMASGAGLAGGTRMEEDSGVDAGLGGNSPKTGETANGESVTNEPNFYENVNSSNLFTDIGITTNSGVDSGLDKGGIERNFDGGETDGGEALRTPRPPAVGGEAAGDGGRRLGAGVATRSVGKAAPAQSVGARGIENPMFGGGEAVRMRQPPTENVGGASPPSQRFFAVGLFDYRKRKSSSNPYSHGTRGSTCSARSLAGRFS